MLIRSALLASVMVLALTLALPIELSASAPVQTETPEPTSTPGYLTVVPLESGGELWVEARWTYGELAVVGSVVAAIMVGLLGWTYEHLIKRG